MKRGESIAIDRFALMIGAMKCGTTSVFRYLAQHPQIAPCSFKEPEFFSDDRKFRRGPDWYRSLWDWNPTQHVWALDASTEYTHPVTYRRTAERIADFGADCRFIYVVRHPIDRIESHYNHAFSAGWVPREIGIDEVVDKRRNYIDRTRYTTFLDGYGEVFGRENVLVLNASEIARDTRHELDRVVSFLGLDPFPFADLDRVHNPGLGRIVESPLIAKMRQRRKLFRAVQQAVPKPAQEIGRRLLGNRLTEPFRFSPDSRRRILEMLADDLERLRSEYAVDTSGWNLEAG